MNEQIQLWANIAQIVSLIISILAFVLAIITWFYPQPSSLAPFLRRARPALLITAIAAFFFWLGTRIYSPNPQILPEDQVGIQATSTVLQATIIALQTQASKSSNTSAAQGHIPTVPATPTVAPTAGSITAVPPTITPEPPTATAMPTPIPAGMVVFETNWNDWPEGIGWNVVNDMLINDGTEQLSIHWLAAPYKAVNIADYAVEAEIQVTAVDRVSCGNKSFGLVARAEGQRGYWAGMSFEFGLESNASGLVIGREPKIDCSQFSDNLLMQENNFYPDTDWHTYRLEVQGNEIRLFVDGTLMLQATDNRYLSGEGLGLWAAGCQINVRSFKVTTL